MAAILQTYLYHHGGEMAGKNVGLIVSSHSSGISGVVADAQRLIPEAEWMGVALWINNANHRNRESLIKNWLIAIDYDALTADVKGDVNGDGTTNISDVMALIDMLLNGNAYQPDADVNDDGSVSISDVSSLTDYLLSGTW